MPNESKEIEKSPPSQISALKKILSSESVQEQFKNALKENSSLFVSSIIDLVGSDNNLQQCNPGLVIKECLKAATLKLPINKNLGFAWVIPYKNHGVPTPQFQMGYRGYIQLAMRTGQYRFINADMIYEGESVEVDKLSGDVQIYGTQEGNTVLGYFAFMETISGFRKTIFWSSERVTDHAKRYSKSWGRKDSPWTTEFDKMALKVLTKEMLSKWGILSVELGRALENDQDDMAFDGAAQREADNNENTKTIDIGDNQEGAWTDDPDAQPKKSGPSF